MSACLGTHSHHDEISNFTSVESSAVASPKFFWSANNLGGAKMFYFMQATVFLFGTLLLKAQNAYIVLKFGGHGPLATEKSRKFVS